MILVPLFLTVLTFYTKSKQRDLCELYDSFKSPIKSSEEKIIEIFINIEKKSYFSELIEQNELNNQHGGRKRRKRGGYQYKGGNGRIVVPQSSNGPPSAGPTDGNSLAVGGAEHLSQNKENATVDDYNAPHKVTMVHGGAKRKKSRTKKHKRRVSIKSRRSKSKKKYRYFQRGCSKKRNGKKKSRRTSKNKSKRKFISGGRRRRSRVKGGYLNQIWGCFS